MTTLQNIKEIEMNFKVSYIYARRVYGMISNLYSLDKVSKIIEEKSKPFVKCAGGKR